MSPAHHPAADLFPLLEGAEFEELKEDIALHGQREPIILWRDGSILDGRNRWRACAELGIEPATRTYDGDDPLAFVVSQNVRRRHLTEGQRALIAARLATATQGERSDLGSREPRLDKDGAAQLLGVSRASVTRGRSVLRRGVPDLVALASRGEAPIAVADRVARQPAEIQHAVLDDLASGRASTLKNALRRRRGAVRCSQVGPVERLEGRYRVIYADPPWEYGNTRAPGHGVPTDHYPTMPLEDICAMPVEEHCWDDAVLFLWAPSPKLEEALRVVNAWGFTYKTCFVWDKVRHNFGYYLSVRHELLLIATRGSCTPDCTERLAIRAESVS